MHQMTPWDTELSGTVSWGRVQKMFFQFYEEVISPVVVAETRLRNEQHLQNQKFITQVETTQKILIWLASFAVAVGMLVIAILGYEHETHKTLLDHTATSSVYAAQTNLAGDR